MQATFFDQPNNSFSLQIPDTRVSTAFMFEWLVITVNSDEDCFRGNGGNKSFDNKYNKVCLQT